MKLSGCLFFKKTRKKNFESSLVLIGVLVLESKCHYFSNGFLINCLEFTVHCTQVSGIYFGSLSHYWRVSIEK